MKQSSTKKFSGKKKWGGLLAALLVCIAIGYGWWNKNESENTATQDAPPAWAKVEKGNLRVVVEATGRVVPAREIEIKCKASGEVVKLPLDVSDPVNEDDLLVQLDTVDEERSVKRAEFALSVSRSRLTQARLNLEIAEKELETEKIRAQAAFKAAEARVSEVKAGLNRTRQLAERKMASPEELDSAQTAFDQAEAELANARARVKDLDTAAVRLDSSRQDIQIAESQTGVDRIALDDARQRLEDTRVTAPISGVIAERDVQIGQIIASGVSNVGGGTTVMTLVDLSQIFVLVSVDESDIGQIQTGQKARVTVDAYPDQSFRGKVVRVAAKGALVSNVVTFEVKVEILDANRNLLKPEMTANVEITVTDKTDLLLLPVAAIQRAKGKQFVNVRASDGALVERKVILGPNDGEKIEIKEGLQEGDTVQLADSIAQSRWKPNNDKDSKNPRGEKRRRGMMRGPH